MAVSVPASARHQALYQATVQQAVEGGGALMGKLMDAARLILQTRQATTRDLRERDKLEDSVRQLRQWEPALTRHFPRALHASFQSEPSSDQPVASTPVAELEFDQLELMDEVQVLTSVALARVQQVTMLAVESSLNEFNTLICTTLGLGAVNAERNPLRPEVYVNALKEVVEQTGLPSTTQLDWLGAMSAALGTELRRMYLALSAQLRSQGVAAAGYAVLQTPTALGVGRGIAQLASTPGAQVAGSAATSPLQAMQPAGKLPSTDATPGKEAVLLTLDRLRQLLTGELDKQAGKSALEVFSQRFAQEFEDAPGDAVEMPAPEFDATVPAALEALNEMRQVDHMVQRLQKRRETPVAPFVQQNNSVDAVRQALRVQAQGVGQSLSLEVVTLMVDNIARDIRLLEPVQQCVRRLEPALLRLALIDQRVFSNKQHPARVLIREITDRSLAFASESTDGFGAFMHGVEQGIAPLLNAAIDNADPFEQALAEVRQRWQQVEQKREMGQRDAVKVLKHAEERNLLAEKIAREIDAHPDAALVPEIVVDFLCGPWSQVVAQARITGGTGSAQADKYQAFISALLWSTHPTLTRNKYAKLTRLVPLLLGTLREGLDSIAYPSTRTSAFLESLMALHQKAFRVAQKPAEEIAEPVPVPRTSASVRLVETGDPWVAPQEAEASNFIELQDLGADVSAGANASEERAAGVDSGETAQAVAPVSGTSSFANLQLGSWVEMRVQDRWVRTQLTWASPHGTLFLFTSAYGTSQSMTRRSRDKMVAAGSLRLIAGQPVVEGALNAVAQIAMRNSVDTVI